MNAADLLAGASLAIFSLGAGVQALRAVALRSAWKRIRARADEFSPLAIDDAASGESTPGVSILLPARLAEGSLILDCVRGCLSVRHPRCEVIVVCEGKGTADALGLTEAFELREIRWLHATRLQAAPVLRMLASRSRGQLIVVEQDGSGRADALNAAMELARNPFVCAIDGRTRLEKDALLRAASPMVEEESVLAVEGMMLPCGTTSGTPPPLRGVVESLEAIELLRRSFLSKAAGSFFGAPPWLSSDFAMYRRHVLVALGGWSTRCADPDAELGVRLHRLAVPPMKGRIELIAEPMGWSVCTGNLSGLVSRWRSEPRSAWDLRTRGLSATASMRAAWRTLGLFGWVAAGLVAVAAVAGVVAIEPVAWLAALYLLLGAIVSLSVLSMESMLKRRVERTSERLLLMGAAILLELLRPAAAAIKLQALIAGWRTAERRQVPEIVTRSGVPRPVHTGIRSKSEAVILSAGAGAAATQFDHPPATDA